MILCPDISSKPLAAMQSQLKFKATAQINKTNYVNSQESIDEPLQIRVNYGIIVRLSNPIFIEQRVVIEQKTTIYNQKNSHSSKRQFGWSL
ncbi:hypothetical protein ACU8V4_11160 [Pseudoalteromonas mariniglutinosa]